MQSLARPLFRLRDFVFALAPRLVLSFARTAYFWGLLAKSHMTHWGASRRRRAVPQPPPGRPARRVRMAAQIAGQV